MILEVTSCTLQCTIKDVAGTRKNIQNSDAKEGPFSLFLCQSSLLVCLLSTIAVRCISNAVCQPVELVVAAAGVGVTGRKLGKWMTFLLPSLRCRAVVEAVV